MEKATKILLTDDVALLLETDRNFLQRDDLDLLVAKDGRIALDMIKQHAPQIAFLGMQMAELSGDQCCRAIKGDPSLTSTTVVLIVDPGWPDQVERAQDAGCDEILTRPINPDEILAIVHRALDLKVRTCKRVKVEMRVYYGAAPQKLLSEFSVDLSTGGLYVKTDVPMPLDENLTLRFTLPEQEQPVTCNARVAWVNTKQSPCKSDLPPGMGVQFVDISLDDLQSIRSFLAQHDLEPSW